MRNVGKNKEIKQRRSRERKLGRAQATWRAVRAHVRVNDLSGMQNAHWTQDHWVFNGISRVSGVSMRGSWELV